MTSVTKILILITTIIAISGEELDLSKDADQSGAQVSDLDRLLDSLYSTKRDSTYTPDQDSWRSKLLEKLFSSIETTKNCDGVYGYFGCVTTDKSLVDMNRQQNIYDQMQPKEYSNNVPSIKNKPGSKRERRFIMKNRKRRSSSILQTSSNKNTTVKVRPTFVNSQPTKISDSKRLIITFLDTISSPFLLIF